MSSTNRLQDFKFSVPWNILLITAGAIIFVTGINGIRGTHSFIPGGMLGLSLFLFDNTKMLSPGLWYLVLNIPLCILGWLMLSKRFLLYTIYAVAVVTLSAEFIKVDFGIHDQLYAAITAGAISGAGSGIILRSLGSAGGSDIIAIILNKYFNIGVGKTFMAFNFVLFSLVAANYDADILIASLILTFVTSCSLDYLLSLFNQRKVVYIISDHHDEIADKILNKLKIGATFIKGRGAYSGRDRDILMAITNNIQLKRLEEVVFTCDSDALFIVENSYDVIGSGFKKRKTY